MWDQNPLLQKLNVDDLARVYEADLKRQRNSDNLKSLSGITSRISVVVVAICVIGVNLV